MHIHRTLANRAAMLAAIALCVATSTAHAAKGVKKVAAGGQQGITGEVTKVTQGNGVGSFHLRTARNHKKLAQGAGGKGNARGQEFQVTAATRFSGGGGRGAGQGNASFASLHRGERVQVQANGNQAQSVHLLGHHNSTGRYHRHYMGRNHRRHHRAGHVQRHSTKHAAHHHHHHQHHHRRKK